MRFFIYHTHSLLFIFCYLFQIITNTENINQVIKHTAYMNVLLINIFFENWQGQKIIDSSEKVFESAYVSLISGSSKIFCNILL